MDEVRAEMWVRLWPTRFSLRFTLLKPWTDAEVEEFAAMLRVPRT